MATTEEERQRQQPISSLNPAFSMQVRPESQRPATGIYGTPRPPAPEGSWVEAPRAAPVTAMPAAVAPPMEPPPVADRAIFGLYPQVTGGSNRSTYANDAALRTGVVATGPRSFQPADPSPVAQGLRRDLLPGVTPSGAGAGRGVVNPAMAQPNAGAMPEQPATQTDSIRGRGQQSPTAPPISVQLGAGAGSAVPGAPGAYRSTAPDGRVLYSDQPGAVSSVAALPSAQNSAAATALSDRSRVESLVATYGLDKARALLNGQPAPEATDPRALLLGQMKAAVDRNAPLTRSGAAVLTSLAASDAQAATSRAQQSTERRRVKVAEDEARIRNTAAITKMAAEQRYAAALAKGDEKEIKAAEDNLRAVQGKWEKAKPPPRQLVVPGGQVVIEGQTVNQPSMVFDPDTGKYILPQAAEKAPYPDNTRLTGKDGKTYVVKNGVPVKE